MPPLTVENASALLGGIPFQEQDMQATKPTPPATVKVKVLRSFQDHQRQILKVNALTELPRIFALEMHAAGKVHILPDEPAPEQVAEKPKRESKKETVNAS